MKTDSVQNRRGGETDQAEGGIQKTKRGCWRRIDNEKTVSEATQSRITQRRESEVLNIRITSDTGTTRYAQAGNTAQ